MNLGDPVRIRERELAHMVGPKPEHLGKMQRDETECSITKPWAGLPARARVVWHRNARGEGAAFHCPICESTERTR